MSHGSDDNTDTESCNYFRNCMGNVVCSFLETPLSSSTVAKNYNFPYESSR